MKIYFYQESILIFMAIVGVFISATFILSDNLRSVFGIFFAGLIIFLVKAVFLAHVELTTEGIVCRKEFKRYYMRWDDVNFIKKGIVHKSIGIEQTICFFKENSEMSMGKITNDRIWIYYTKRKERRIIEFAKKNSLIDKVIDLSE